MKNKLTEGELSEEDSTGSVYTATDNTEQDSNTERYMTLNIKSILCALQQVI